MIRPATDADVPHIVEMALKFIEAGGLPEGRPDDLAQFARGLLANDAGFLAVSKAGFIAGFAAPLYYRPDYLEAHEVAWWSEDGQGLYLLAAFEEWAQQIGAQQAVLSTIHTTDKRASLWLERKGYAPTETNFRKAI